MTLDRRISRIEAARPPTPLSAEEYWRLWSTGRIPEGQFDAFVARLSDEELNRVIEIVSAHIGLEQDRLIELARREGTQ